jgi:hypothetical protein
MYMKMSWQYLKSCLWQNGKRIILQLYEQMSKFNTDLQNIILYKSNLITTKSTHFHVHVPILIGDLKTDSIIYWLSKTVKKKGAFNRTSQVSTEQELKFDKNHSKFWLFCLAKKQCTMYRFYSCQTESM